MGAHLLCSFSLHFSVHKTARIEIQKTTSWMAMKTNVKNNLFFSDTIFLVLFIDDLYFNFYWNHHFFWPPFFYARNSFIWANEKKIACFVRYKMHQFFCRSLSSHHSESAYMISIAWINTPFKYMQCTYVWNTHFLHLCNFNIIYAKHSRLSLFIKLVLVHIRF